MTDQTNPAHDQREDLPVRMLDLPVKQEAPVQASEKPLKSLNAQVADLLRPFLKPGQKVIWREPFRWFDDNGVMSNHYDGMSVANLADDFGYDYDWEFAFAHAAIVWPKTASLPSTSKETQHG
jgi:hypothetical protein